jgi:hypothetical protein
MTEEAKESTIGVGKPKRRHSRQLPPGQQRSQSLFIRVTPDLHETLEKTAKAWSIDISTLAFNILNFTTRKKQLTVEEARAFAKGNSVARNFFRRAG